MKTGLSAENHFFRFLVLWLRLKTRKQTGSISVKPKYREHQLYNEMEHDSCWKLSRMLENWLNDFSTSIDVPTQIGRIKSPPPKDMMWFFKVFLNPKKCKSMDRQDRILEQVSMYHIYIYNMGDSSYRFVRSVMGFKSYLRKVTGGWHPRKIIARDFFECIITSVWELEGVCIQYQ